jgi:hypothetical protein
MSRSSLGLVFGAVATIVAITFWWSQSDKLVVERPDWMQVDTPSDVRASSNISLERTEVVVPKDSPVASMAPPESISGALETAGQKIQFQASALMDSELASGVAKEMVAAANAHWEIYQISVYEKEDDMTVRNMDYLFSAWPDIPRLIADKEVKVVVNPAPNGAIQGSGSITYSYKVVEDVLSVAFHLPRWRVRIDFNNSSYQPKLRKRIADYAAESINDARAKRKK